MSESDEQAFMATHGEAGDGTVFPLLRYVIVGLDLRDHFGEQCLLIQFEALLAQSRSPARFEHCHVAIPKRHDDNHRLRFTRSNQAIKDEVRLSHG